MIKIPRLIIDEMVSHAKAEFPIECCGLLAGRDQEVTRFYKLTNKDRSSNTYLMDSKEQFEAFKEFREKDIDLLAIYHSHIRSRAYPSKTDVRLAYYPDPHYIIISLEDIKNIDIKAFKINEEIITEGEIKVICKDAV